MYLTANIITFWLHIAIFFSVGYSAQMTEQDSSFVIDEVFKNLPTATCDMIVISSVPFPGEIKGLDPLHAYIVQAQ